MEEKQNENVSVPLLIANITLVCFVASFGFMIYQTKHQKPPVIAEVKKIDESAFQNLTLSAQSVYIFDVSTQHVIFAKDPFTPRPLASLTKIMTAVTAMSILPKNTTITVQKEFLAEEGDSGLYVNEKWNFKNLLDFSLVVSSNDGARSIASVAGAFASSTADYTIARATFIEKMNQIAAGIGLSSMHFNNETGLDISETMPGASGSAKDMTTLMEYAMRTYPNILEATKNSSEIIYSDNKKHVAINTDVSVSKISSLIASKTGYTSLSGGNLSVAFDAGVGRPIIITVLGSTYDGRFIDIEKLASSTITYIQENGD